MCQLGARGPDTWHKLGRLKGRNCALCVETRRLVTTTMLSPVRGVKVSGHSEIKQNLRLTDLKINMSQKCRKISLNFTGCHAQNMVYE